MECSQAVLMLMLLVPCEQSGGQSPEMVIVEQREAAPVVQAEGAPDRLLPAEPVLPAAAASEPAERSPSGDQRVPE